MDYNKVSASITKAWMEFYASLVRDGVVDAEGVDKLDFLLDRKDCFNDVEDCVMECVK